ncbi:hypothetical protein [Tabrizicola sp. BL-A-41-H6]|uniref:hypothetical protein n=1 Tax=Tabrizicola sp. BL-A-41-H6 TaxID=3421107 RepID=UPI003D67431E
MTNLETEVIGSGGPGQALESSGDFDQTTSAALETMLARLPFAITEELDPGAVHKQFQGAISSDPRLRRKPV